MKKLNILFFAVLLSFVFNSIFFQKNTNADSNEIPKNVAKRLIDSCNSNNEMIWERTYDREKEEFSPYDPSVRSITGNWISADPEGKELISSIYEKHEFQISKENRSFYLNIAAIACKGQAEASAVNVRIMKELDYNKLETNGLVTFGDSGQGAAYDFILGAKKYGRIAPPTKITVKESAIDKLSDGDFIQFKVWQCWAPYGNGSYGWRKDHRGAPGNCYDHTIKIRIKAPVKFNVEGDTKAAVLESNQRIRSDDSRFKGNGRYNPQTAKVGQWVSFRHKVTGKDFNKNSVNGSGQYQTFRNDGHGDYSVNSNYNFRWNNSRPTIINQGNIWDTINAVGTDREIFKVTGDMAGKTICSKMSYGVSAGDIDNVNRYNKTTNEACVYVPYDFEITPCVKIDKIRNCSGGDLDIPTNGKVPNDPNDGEEILIPGGGTATSSIKYKITTWRVPSDKEGFATHNNKRDNKNSDTCSPTNFYYQDYQGIEKCRVVKEGTGKFNRDTRVADFIPSIEEGAEAGTRYCAALSISPYEMNSNQNQAEQAKQERENLEWRHSAPICIKLVKKPKVQFWGNGVYSRSGVRTSLSPTEHGVLGSWVEYEALSGMKIKDFRTESSQSTQKLAIEDYSSKGSFGQGKASIDSLISNISSKFPKKNFENVNTKVEVYNDSHKQLGAIWADKQTKVIYGKNIRISSDIVNADRAVNSDTDFHQIIIIADGDITIDQGVKRVDAWLIARGVINTCAVNGAQNVNDVNMKNCDNQLRIRGGTVSRNLRLWRTAGSDGTIKDTLSNPAEIFNQSADTYLWAQAQSGSEGKIVTTYTKELPVRY
jgi:hypothetical protein